MKVHMSIGGIRWSVETDRLDQRMSLFLDEKQDIETEISLRILPDAQLRYGETEPLMVGENCRWERTSDGGYIAYVHDMLDGSLFLGVSASASFTSSEARYLPDSEEEPSLMAFHAGDILLRYRSLFHGGFVLHASLVDAKGTGILFSAPSQTGKTTQAKLWEAHRGAIVLNGDRPAIGLKEGQYIGYGTPWCGAIPLFAVGEVPIRAVVLLEQAPFNKVELLPMNRALPLVLARTFMPYFDAALSERAMENVGGFLQSVPAYLLQCRPDADAVATLAAFLGLPS